MRRGAEHAGRTRRAERENTKKNYKYVLNSFSSLVKVSFMHLFIHLSISLFIHLFTYLFITYLSIHLFIIFFFHALTRCVSRVPHSPRSCPSSSKKRRKIYSYSLLIKNTYYIFIGPSFHILFFFKRIATSRNFAKHEQ